MNKLVVHCKQADYDVYVGRGRCPQTDKYYGWGNPFVEGRDGTRQEVIEKFRELVLSRPDYRERAIRQLRGKVLGCWCAPQPCHGDVLAEIANDPNYTG